jgi:hypothetical protein
MVALLRRRAPDTPLYGFSTFVATVLAMPLIKDGYDPVEQRISQGALGEYGLIQVFGILALAAGTFAVAYQVRVSCEVRHVHASAELTMASAACVAIVAIVPTDRPGGDTVHGNIHLWLAVCASLLTIGGMMCGAFAFPRAPRLRTLAKPSLAFAVVSISLLAAMAAGIEPEGLVQRIAVVCQLSWLALLAWALRAQCREGGEALPARAAGTPR